MGDYSDRRASGLEEELLQLLRGVTPAASYSDLDREEQRSEQAVHGSEYQE